MKMNKKKIVKEIFSESAIAQDYEYAFEREWRAYSFVKQEDGVEKIFLIQDLYNVNVRIVFMTNINAPVFATDLVDRSICKVNDRGECEYKNEEEFRAIVLEAKRIFEQYSDEMFKKLSIPPKRDNSTPEMEKELYENREQLIKDGIQFLGIEGMIGLKRVRMIVEKLKELQDKPFQSVISELIMLSAVYGSIYCEMSHGEWQFDGEWVSIVNKELFLIVEPLKEMIHTWKAPENENLTNLCEFAWKKYNHCWY